MNKTTPRVLAVHAHNPLHQASDSSWPPPLDQICRLFGYPVRAYTARDLGDFRRTLRFVGAVARLPAFREDPLLVHVSISGDPHGMRIGADTTDWGQSAPLLSELCRGLAPYPGPVTLAVSVLGAPEEVLAGLVPARADCVRPPAHVLVFFEESIGPVEATLAWTHLFGAAAALGLADESAVDPARLNRLRTRLRDLGAGTLQYFHLGPAPFQSGPHMP